MTERQQRLSFILGVAVLLQALFLIASYFGEARQGARFGPDFASFWNAARHVVEGRPDLVYDVDAWRRILSGHGQVTLAWFVYPPFALLGLWPLGLLDYNPAVAWWTLLPLPLFAWLVLRQMRGEGRAGLIVLMLSLPLLAANMFTGQIGAWMAVMWLAAALWSDRRPIACGTAIGLLAIKPQFGVLFPVALMAARRWKIIAAAAITIAVLLILSIAAFGIGIWTDYFAMSKLFGAFIGLGRRDFSDLALSPYVSLLSAGLPSAVAIVIQAIAMAASAFAIFFLNRNAQAGDGQTDLRLAALAIAAFLTTPYGLTYDSPALVLVLIALVRRAWRTGWTLLSFLAVFAIAEVPILNLQFAKLHMPFGLVALFFAAAAVRRAYLAVMKEEWLPRA